VAKEDHLRAVRQGNDGIFALRSYDDSNLDLEFAVLDDLDLSDCDLQGSDFSGAKLRNVDLTRAVLSDAIMQDCRCDRVDMTSTNLERARLLGARFEDSMLLRANLSDAAIDYVEFHSSYLTGANLVSAQFRETSFDRTDLSKSTMGLTVVIGCDLNGARGLDSISHDISSSIDVDTLVYTLRGGAGTFSPEQLTFFLSAGVPPAILKSLPGLLETQPLQFFSCFISYGQDDVEFTAKLYRSLRKAEVPAWMYAADAVIGRGVWANIERAMTTHQKVVLVCSQSSLKSPGVIRELERCLQREDDLKRRGMSDIDVVVPVMLDDYVFNEWEHSRRADVVAKHIGDFREWRSRASYSHAFDNLLKALDPSHRLGLSSGTN
jgi:uncharacterized protein YjbI with pentapeptide repeats